MILRLGTLLGLLPWALCCLTARDATAQKPLDAKLGKWFDEALEHREEPDFKMPDASSFDQTIGASDIAPTTQMVWKAYREAAIRAGWDKRLLPTPKTLEALAQLPPDQRKLEASVMKSSDGLAMPYLFIAKGKKPEKGWPLFISMHGGGKYYGKKPLEGPHQWGVNSREWQAQMMLTQHVYRPAGLYFLPRMADDRKGRWFHKHNIELFDRMIRTALLFNDVDPNRVYMMGISQGGYGSCHLGPFMADRLAAVGPMAGGMMTVVENLRNLPFRSDIGEHDTAYNRIKLAHQLHDAIDKLREKDPQGYENKLAIQKGKGHGIDYHLSPDWLAQHERNPYPDRVVWRCFAKDGVYQKNFYWISLSQVPTQGEFDIDATIDRTTNTIIVTAQEVIPVDSGENEEKKEPIRKPLESAQVIVRLNDKLVDLNRPLTIKLNGQDVYTGQPTRKLSEIMKNIVERGDRYYAFPVAIPLSPKNE